MSKLFKRKWRVTVGTLASENVSLKFEIKRSLTSLPGTASIDIRNLTESHRAEIKDAVHPIVRIEAGYDETGMSMLFQGNERTTFTHRDDADIITTITAGDGENSIRTLRGARSFGPETTLSDVVQYVADQLGIGTGNLGDVLGDASLDRLGNTFPRGTVFHGNVAREFTEILRSCGLEWSIQEGTLQVLQRGNALQREAIRLSPATGMLDSPEIGKNHVVTVKSLLIPDLVPGRLVQIDSSAISGTYRIESATYAGDTNGEEWTATMQTRERA